MTDLTTLTAGERRRILDDYLDAVFGDQHSARRGADARSAHPTSPTIPTPDQVAAWVELAELLRDPDFIATSRRMARACPSGHAGAGPDQSELSKAIGEHGRGGSSLPGSRRNSQRRSP